MTQLTTLTLISTLCVSVFITDSVTVCADTPASLRQITRSTQAVDTRSVKVDDAAEQGRRGRVQTKEGVAVGEIEDFLIEPEKGCIAYGVFSHTGRKAPDHLAILPWELIRLDPKDPTMSNFRLQGERNLLGVAPHVSRAQWTTSAVADWLGTVEEYWIREGIPPCTIPTASSASVIKASEVVGMDIQTDSGAVLGTIRELILDGKRGEVASVIVVQEDPSSPSSRTFFALPWNTLHVSANHHTLVIHLGAQTII
jgi:sporulation protein YlmC with PRC-barrel domain